MDIVSDSKIENWSIVYLDSLIDTNRCNVEVDFKNSYYPWKIDWNQRLHNSKMLIKSFPKISKLKTKLLEYEFKIWTNSW